MKLKQIAILSIIFVLSIVYVLGLNVLDSPQNYTTSQTYVTVKEFFFDPAVNVSKHEFQAKTADGSKSAAIGTTFNYTDNTTGGGGHSIFDTTYTTYSTANPNQSKLVNYVKIQLGSAYSIGAYIQLKNITYETYLSMEFVDPTPTANSFLINNLTINVSIIGSSINHTVINFYNDTAQTNLIKTDEFIGDTYPSVFYNETYINYTKYGYTFFVNVTHTNIAGDVISTTRKFNYLTLDDCDVIGGTGITNIINYTLRDETNNSLLFGDIYIDLETNNGINTNIAKSNTTTLALCLGTGQTANVTGEVRHDVGYTNYYYYVDSILGSDYVEQRLYNSPIGHTKSTLQTTVNNQYFTALTDIIVKMERNFPPNSTWTEVQADTTDNNGQVFFHIIEETTKYRFKFYDGTTLLDTKGEYKFTCDTDTCLITFIIDDTPTKAAKNLAISQNFNNNTKILSINFNDPTGSTSQVNIDINKETMAGSTTVCTTTIYSSSGSFDCNLTGNTGTFITNTYTVPSGDIPYKTDVLNIDSDQLFNYIGVTDSVFWGFILTIIFVILGLVNPISVLIALFLSILFSSYLGLSNVFGYSYLVILGIISLVLGLIVRKR